MTHWLAIELTISIQINITHTHTHKVNILTHVLARQKIAMIHLS